MSNTLYSAAELLPEFLNDPEVLNGEGSIAFTKPDKTTARIFLKEGSIYAVDNLSYEAHLWNELRFEKHISHSNLTALIRAYNSQRESLYKLLKKTRTKMKNDGNLVIALQEYTLGAIDDIYSWDSVKLEWRMGDTFQYDATHVPPFSLQHLLTLCVNRSLFKFNKYEQWGFKNDSQFLYGNVLLEGAIDDIKAQSALEEAILLAKKFIIRGLAENTGYSLYTIASALDDLSQRLTVNIENPSGRQKPTTAPTIPHDVPVIRDKIHFSDTDEDPGMLKVFNTEYHVPEPALLEDTPEAEEEKSNKAPSNPAFDSFNDVINNTSSMEVVAEALPPLKKEANEPAPTTSRIPIPKTELEKEDAANDIASLYKSVVKEVPKARGTVKKPVATRKSAATPEKTDPQDKEAVETVSSEKNQSNKETNKPTATKTEGKDMANESPLVELLQKVEAQLSDHKARLEDHKHIVQEKEAALKAAHATVSRATVALNDAKQAQEEATAEYEKALQIINALHS